MDHRPADAATRVLVFAPIGRDASLTHDLLTHARIPATVCESVEVLCRELAAGAAAIVLTEEALEAQDFDKCREALQHQPPWSDVAVLLFAGATRDGGSARLLDILEQLPNVTLIDRPVRVAVVISIARAAVRARTRQLEVRDLLAALEASREQAETANRLKDEFLATLSHELRTPLNAILGWTSMLRGAPLDTSRTQRGLEVIDKNARAQAQLVDDILDVARVITGKLRVELKPVSLPGIIQAAVQALRPAADAKRLRLEVTGSDDDVVVHADSGRLQQVLWNLLSNAVKFTPEGGRIEVRVRRSASRVAVSVTDSGIGVAPHFLPFVFDRFRQADQTVTRTHGGLGLGLSIVKHLVELHGGTVSVHSEGLGRGTTFTVQLPIPALRSPDLSSSLTDNPLAIDLRGRSLLVVDDDPFTRELLKELFDGTQARVATAESAAEAMTLLTHEPPDVMVADIGLPEEDGLSLMRRIRGLDEPVARVPSLALSAYTRMEDRQAAHDAGFDDFLGKPASPIDVLRAVERLLASRP